MTLTRAVEFTLAGAEDDEEIRGLLRARPMEGEVRVSLEREPDAALAATIAGDVHQVVVARREGRLVGIGSRAVAEAWVDGRRTRLAYLSQLRFAPSERSGGRELLRGGFGLLGRLHEQEGSPPCMTTILADNRAACRLLERGLPGLPVYRRVGTLATLLIPVLGGRRRPPAGLTVERGAAERLGEVAELLQRCAPRYQFARHWTRDELASPERTRGLAPEDLFLAVRGGRLVGCAARWDQRGFKQAVIRGYSPRLRRLRPAINLFAGLLRTPRLPPVGTALAMAYVSHVAVDDDDPGVLVALLDAMARDSRGRLDLLTVGLAAEGPLARAVRGGFRHWEYVSNVYAVGFKGEPAAGGGGRLTQPEAATL